jgi:hypothetical protein
MTAILGMMDGVVLDCIFAQVGDRCEAGVNFPVE